VHGTDRRLQSENFLLQRVYIRICLMRFEHHLFTL
jgi:hypothetical protein